MNNSPNNGVQGTAHKVRRPLTPDVRRKNMNTKYIVFFLVILLPGWAIADDSPLPAKLFDVTLDYIQANGPDEDAADFIAMMGPHSWDMRESIARETIPFITNSDPNKVSGALAILYRLRGYRPMSDLVGAGGSAWEQKYKPATFWEELDQSVCSRFEHFHTLSNSAVFHNLALYLGVSPSDGSRQELLRIATETTEKDQAVICLAWHRAPKDMPLLLPFMLENTQTSKSLPYHFRNSYGTASIPYLKQAIEMAQSESTRREAINELNKIEAMK